MTKKKKIAATCVFALILSIGTTSVFAANNDVFKMKADKLGVISEDVKGPQIHDDLVATVAKVGINIDGMTDEQIESALGAYKLSQLEKTNPNGLSRHEQLIAAAAKVDIKTDGMTDEQIEAVLVDYKQSHLENIELSLHDGLVATAAKVGINTDSMTDEQIEAALTAYKQSRLNEASAAK